MIVETLAPKALEDGAALPGPLLTELTALYASNRAFQQLSGDFPDPDDIRPEQVAAALAARFGERVHIVEPYATTLPRAFDGTGARLIDIDTALETCGAMIVLVDHDIFRSVPLDERRGKTVLDTRGLWPDQS